MNDPFLMKRGERAEHGQGNLDGFTGQQRAPGEARAQRLALEELHGEEQPVSVLVNLVQLAHVGMIDARRCARLPPEALPLLTVTEARPDPLDGDGPVQAIVMRRIDNAHTSFSELAHDAIAARHLDMRPSSFNDPQPETTAVLSSRNRLRRVQAAAVVKARDCRRSTESFAGS